MITFNPLYSYPYCSNFTPNGCIVGPFYRQLIRDPIKTLVQNLSRVVKRVDTICCRVVTLALFIFTEIKWILPTTKPLSFRLAINIISFLQAIFHCSNYVYPQVMDSWYPCVSISPRPQWLSRGNPSLVIHSSFILQFFPFPLFSVCNLFALLRVLLSN